MYILARKKWINSIKNSRAYSSFEGVKSDHRIVSSKCQISYRKSNIPTKNPMKQIDWRKVVGDANLCEEFTVAVHTRFNTLCDKLEDKNASVVYDSLSIANRDIALEILPKKKKKILTFASNETVTKAREELKNTAQSRSTRNTERNIEATKASLDEAHTKTPGPENIPAVIWKSPLFHEHHLLDFCNETYKGNKPAAFSMSSITPLPKKGDL